MFAFGVPVYVGDGHDLSVTKALFGVETRSIDAEGKSAWEGGKPMTTKTTGTFKPGQIVPKSGQIQQTGSKTEKTVVQGEKFPPTNKSGQTYKYVDVTKHKK